MPKLILKHATWSVVKLGAELQTLQRSIDPSDSGAPKLKTGSKSRVNIYGTIHLNIVIYQEFDILASQLGWKYQVGHTKLHHQPTGVDFSMASNVRIT